MIRSSQLRYACSRAKAISTKAGHSAHWRFKSPMRMVVLFSVVTIPATSHWIAAPAIVGSVNEPGATRPYRALGVTAPAVGASASKTTDGQLATAAPLDMPKTDSDSHAGPIEGTLRDTLVRASVPADMREHIARIFAPRLDLAAPAQKGDTYRVLYRRDDSAGRSRRLMAVELRSGGKAYQAVWYIVPGRTDGHYYSLDGQPLAGNAFSMPLEHVRVSSPFGYRTHPVKGKHMMHTGVDFAAPQGTSVGAAASGTVRHIGFQPGYGNIVVLSHPRGFTTHYAHLSAFARDLRLGARVTEGQSLGTVGSTGTATGPHLHFEVRAHNQPIDPLTLTSGNGATRLTGSQRTAFDRMTGALREQLAALPVDTSTVRMASNAKDTPKPPETRKDSLT